MTTYLAGTDSAKKAAEQTAAMKRHAIANRARVAAWAIGTIAFAVCAVSYIVSKLMT